MTQTNLSGARNAAAVQTYDAIIVGAGPAGLTAATYLARYRRRVLVLGAGRSRAGWIPESHNTPGFPRGVGGAELLDRLTRQAAQYGVVSRQVRVETMVRSEDESFEVSGGDFSARGSTLLLATGVEDHLPDVEGLEPSILEGVVRMCPICDAYEAIGTHIAVLGDGELAKREAAFLRTYSDQVRVIGAQEGRFSFEEGAANWTGPDGAAERFDHLYLALGCRPRSELGALCGARLDETGSLIVDAHQMSSIAGLYAAGDVVRGLNQIAVAAGEAAIAATAIHNRLPSG